MLLTATRAVVLKGLGPSPHNSGGGGVGDATNMNGSDASSDVSATTQKTWSAEPSAYLQACAASGMQKDPTPNMASTKFSADPARLGNIQPRDVNTALFVKL